MKSKIDLKILDILSCPYCGNDLLRIKNGLKCSSCEEEYKDTKKGQFDLRLQKVKDYTLQFKLGNNFLQDKEVEFEVLKKNENSEIDLTNIKIPRHLSEELISYFPKANKNDFMLDLGCGRGIHRKICEYIGYEYIGLDYESPTAQILADAHAIPFKDNSFKFVLSIAVLEHIQYPFVMMREVHRILKPGGFFIGTVAFLQSFHSRSFYHHSHLGVLNILQYADLKISKIAPSAQWSVLIALSKSLFPYLSLKISRFIMSPINLLHRIWWKISDYFNRSNTNYFSEKNRILYHTGFFSFIARKN